MPQLHCYVADDIAAQISTKATQAGLNLSRYLAELIKRDVTVDKGWSAEYLDNFGKWEGLRLERPEQLPVEDRIEFQ
jgi:hypothetical protein